MTMGLRGIGSALGTVGRFAVETGLNLLDPTRKQHLNEVALERLKASLLQQNRLSEQSFLTQQDRDAADAAYKLNQMIQDMQTVRDTAVPSYLREQVANRAGLMAPSVMNWEIPPTPMEQADIGYKSALTTKALAPEAAPADIQVLERLGQIFGSPETAANRLYPDQSQIASIRAANAGQVDTPLDAIKAASDLLGLGRERYGYDPISQREFVTQPGIPTEQLMPWLNPLAKHAGVNLPALAPAAPASPIDAFIANINPEAREAAIKKLQKDKNARESLKVQGIDPDAVIQKLRSGAF